MEGSLNSSHSIFLDFESVKITLLQSPNTHNTDTVVGECFADQQSFEP